MIRNTSKCMRNDQLFMRNEYAGRGKWNIPLVRKQELNVDNLSLIACSDTKSNDSSMNTQNGIHFFVDDYRFNGIYNNPEKSLAKYSQYAFLLTPDFSTYADMSLWRQMESVAKNRWCGAYWQNKGLTVIPTISWSTPSSYDFCFDGVEENSIVAIGMIGCKQNRFNFMRGYYTMLEKSIPKPLFALEHHFQKCKGISSP